MNNFLDITKFKILNKIGSGGYSNVYRIQEFKTGKIFSAKIFRDELDDSNMKYIFREINTISSISHPLILKYYGFSSQDFNKENHIVIVNEYMQNGSLSGIINLEKNGQAPSNWNFTKKLINIFGIASGMKYLHSHCIIHRDLKPSNILEDSNYYPKICGIENSKIFRSISQMNSMPRGTPCYMAPEIITEENYSNSVDVYSFGMTIYELLTGNLPKFNAKNIFQLMKLIMSNLRPEIDSNVPKSYRELIAKCWSTKLDERPSFTEIVSLIKNDPGFITEEVDEDEFRNYILYIESGGEAKQKEEEQEDEDILSEEQEIPMKVENDPYVLNATKLEIKNFSKQEKLGNGFSGDVYKIIDKTTKSLYAAKIMKDEFYAKDKNTNKAINLAREVQILSKISHPSIMRFFGYSSTDFINLFRPVIIMEYVKNGTLEDIIEIERSGLKISFWNDTMKLINIYGIAASMEYLHSKNILHRDLKPGNILIDEFLFPKLADFGFSKSLSNQEEDEEENDENETFQHQINSKIMGTDSFIAPEIWSDQKYTKSGDVYAFAMLVYEIISTEFPFYGKNDCQIMYIVSILKERPKMNQNVPKHFRNLINECWNQDPNKRPTFGKIVHKLETDERFISEHVDKTAYFKYIEYIKKSLQIPDKLFIKYSLEPIYNECKEKKSTLIGNGFLSIDKYVRKSELYENDISKFFCVEEKKTKKEFVAEASKFDVLHLTLNETQNLSHEVEVLSKLKHPAIQQFIGYSMLNFKHRPKPIIIREYSSNLTLFDVIEKVRNGETEPKWNDTKKLINIYGIASGMKYLHLNGILHHELKTKNILVDDDLRPKITKFGFYIKPQNSRKVLSESMNSNKEIQYYLSPEILKSKEPTKSSDVYSFAFIVYEIVTSEVPFHYVKNQKQLFDEVVTKYAHPSLSKTIPHAYRKLISSCWEQDPRLRPSFESIVKELETNNKFITEKIDKNEFLNYVKSIETSNKKL